MSSTRKVLTLLVIALALGLLYPGVTKPILTLTGSIEKSQITALGIDIIAGEDADSQSRQMLSMLSGFLGLDKIEGQLEAYRTTRSIMDTVDQLARTGNLLVAFLLVFFSVVIPVFKLFLLACAMVVPGEQFPKFLLKTNSMLSKWSMADVFVMALLVAYMAGSAAGNEGDLLIMGAQLEVGFYYFLAYCLSSIAAGSMLMSPSRTVKI